MNYRIDRRVVAPGLMMRSIGSREHEPTRQPQGRALTCPEFVLNDSGRIAGRVLTRFGLSLPSPPLFPSWLLGSSSVCSGRSVVPRAGDPSPLIDTRIHLVSFLSAKWPGSRPGSFLSDSTARAICPRDLPFSLLSYLRKAECAQRAKGTKGTEAPLASDARRRGEGEGRRGEINADCYSRNLMRSHLPGTWPALVCACVPSQSPRALFVEMAEDVPATRPPGFTNPLRLEESLSLSLSLPRSDLPHPLAP